MVNREVFERRKGEFNDLVELLLAHRSGKDMDTERWANTIAYACLGENHLWQDLKLQNRQELSDILEKHFKPLFDKNTHDMKWKKFFYKQLCEMEGVYVCKSPSCGVCIDYHKCFGPED